MIMVLTGTNDHLAYADPNGTRPDPGCHACVVGKFTLPFFQVYPEMSHRQAIPRFCHTVGMFSCHICTGTVSFIFVSLLYHVRMDRVLSGWGIRKQQQSRSMGGGYYTNASPDLSVWLFINQAHSIAM